MATLPENRKKLMDRSRMLERRAEDIIRMAGEIRSITVDIIRRPAVKRAPTQRARMTAAIKRKIIDTAAANPDMPNDEIGRLHGVDGGRVSEVLAGKRPRDGEAPKPAPGLFDSP